MTRKLDYKIVYKYLRKKDFGIITTLNENGYPHTTGVLYGISDHNSDLKIFIISGREYRKTKNIRNSPKVSFVIPFPHHILRFVPANMITIEGNAIVVDFDRDLHEKYFLRSRVLKTNLDFIEVNPDTIVIEISPNKKILGYGIGVGIFKMKKNHSLGPFHSLIK